MYTDMVMAVMNSRVTRFSSHTAENLVYDKNHDTSRASCADPFLLFKDTNMTKETLSWSSSWYRIPRPGQEEVLRYCCRWLYRLGLL